MRIVCISPTYDTCEGACMAARSTSVGDGLGAAVASTTALAAMAGSGFGLMGCRSAGGAGVGDPLLVAAGAILFQRSRHGRAFRKRNRGRERGVIVE